MKISIITVVFNREKTIRESIESVMSQKEIDLEYNIKDGKSQDNTLNIIKSFSDHPKIKIESKIDDGIYDAFNQAIEMCTGDIIGFLHSDDVFVDEFVLKDVVSNFKDYDVVYGNTIFVNEDNKITRVWKGKYGNIKRGWAPPHTALFVKSSVYKKHGCFDTKYNIAADYDFMIRIFSDPNIKTKYIDRNIIYMKNGGISTSGFKSNIKSYKEIQDIYKKNNLNFTFLRQISRISRRFFQFFVNKKS